MRKEKDTKQSYARIKTKTGETSFPSQAILVTKRNLKTNMNIKLFTWGLPHDCLITWINKTLLLLYTIMDPRLGQLSVRSTRAKQIDCGRGDGAWFGYDQGDVRLGSNIHHLGRLDDGVLAHRSDRP